MLRLFLLLALWPLSLAAQGTRTVTPTAGNATTSQSATANALISPPTLFTPPPPDSDDDGDGLSLALELIRGSDPNIPNTDGDAAPDALDGWPREAAITQPPLPATGYVHVPLSALHPAFPATGNPPFVVRRLGNDWRVLTETLFNSGPSTRELHLRDLRTGTSELVLTAPASYAAHCFGLSGVDADAFFAKYAMWMNSSPSGEHGPFGFPGISSYASNPLHRPDRAVARNGGIASCFFNGSSIQTRYRAPDGTTRLLPLNPLPIPPGGDVSFQTATPLLVNDAGDVVTLEIGYFGRKNSSSATYYATRSKHLAIYLNRANGASQRLGPGMDRLIRPTESTSGSIFLPYTLTNEGKMMGQLFSADGSPALFGWWNDQFRPAPPGTGSALYVSAIDAAPGRPALGLTTKTPSGSRWAMEAPDGTVTWPDAEVWLPQQQVQGRPHQIRGLNSELEYVADAAITSQGSSVWNGVTRNGVFQQIPAPAGYSPIYTDINDHGALLSGRYLTIQASLTVDANRDGIIDDQDVNAVTVAKPYRFWSNDDDDGDSDGATDNINSSTKDYETTGFFDLNGIRNTRDLEDFARLHLHMGGPHEAFKNGNLQLGLKWTNVTGTPKINLYKAYESDGGDQYLRNPAIAAEQIQNEYDNPVESIGGEVTVAPGATFVFKQEIFANLSEAQPKTHFIFEGAGEGKGQLKIVTLKDGMEISEGPGVWFDLVNIKSMYERAVATAAFNESWHYAHAGDVPAFLVSIAPDPKGHSFQQPANETKESLVFVHGWKMEEDDVRSFAETMFKRLWWQGYRGRFRVLRWPTYTGDYSFSESEFMAWKCGSVLKNYIEGSVPGASLPSDYTKCVAAHSLGNVVVGSALKQGLVPDRYFAMQGAIPSGCYDTSDAVNGFASPASASSAFDAVPSIVVLRSMFSGGESSRATPDDTSPDWGYRGYLTGAYAGKVVNFCNPQDFALTTGSTIGIDTNWLAWQFGYKPRDRTISGDINFEYRYIPTAPEGQRLKLYRYTDTTHDTVDAERPIADAHESMGFLARTRSLPLGADTQAGGIVNTTINLRDAYGFTESRGDHGGQFRRSIQNVRPFYQRIIQEME